MRSKQRSGQERTRSGRPARRVAYETLRAVTDEDAYANLTLPGLIRRYRLDTRDAAFATELTYGTLRGLGIYDQIIEACIDRTMSELDPRVLEVLRLGAHQTLAMRVPAHAAVSTMVDLVRATVSDGAGRFVNAVMRRIGEHDLDAWTHELAPSRDADPEGFLAFRYAHPPWIVRALRDSLNRYGPGSGSRDQADALESCLAANNEPASVVLAAWPARGDVAELTAAGAQPTRWSPYGAVLDSGDPGRLDAVKAGRAGVQDEGSQLVTLAVTGVPVEGDDARWLDMCAGPGGKAAVLAGLAHQRGAQLVALDQHPHRARLVEQALRGAPGEHSVVVGDATDEQWQDGSYDRVLLDAPCSGLGALRRRPEARWRRTPSDIAQLRPLQTALLQAAVRAVRPGGVVGYITCSPHLAETVTVVEDILRRNDDIERVDARPYLPGVPDLGSGPDVQLWPHVHGTDAMYLALLRRT
ncbi:rRNA cytosine-C5-methyltransferase [Actinobacteria bacterium YIM 96077]|uniref:rRNA cytosine-C5-methyltransferase n=1 Tax=Phytoactinopolyspora halophila TaxID=1981511 RepID=A0A329QPL4_9ACTN|nr:rRNA cytosine-C5-methyltransferase [Actinobacteria bacterium YIM 96077]RAW13292.1 rRNA cytosine-C5-methyltransferase [Phytoactinopolyspora halophila]